jgi:hypothetical protein
MAKNRTTPTPRPGPEANGRAADRELFAASLNRIAAHLEAAEQKFAAAKDPPTKAEVAVAGKSADFLRRLVRRRALDPAMRLAARRELLRRRFATYREAQAEAVPAAREMAESDLWSVLHDAELKGVFAPGEHLDLIWELVAVALAPGPPGSEIGG